MQPMGGRMKRLGLDKLPIDEQLALLDELWESVASVAPVSLQLSPEEIAELDRRLDALEAGGDRGRPAAEVLAELRRSR